MTSNRSEARLNIQKWKYFMCIYHTMQCICNFISLILNILKVSKHPIVNTDPLYIKLLTKIKERVFCDKRELKIDLTGSLFLPAKILAMLLYTSSDSERALSHLLQKSITYQESLTTKIK